MADDPITWIPVRESERDELSTLALSTCVPLFHDLVGRPGITEEEARALAEARKAQMGSYCSGARKLLNPLPPGEEDR